MSPVTKVVIPVAGLGTRMLPATKAIPKEMLPMVDRPIIQYIVDECIAAGLNDIILVTHSSKNAIENHFDTSFELEATLEKRVKRQLLNEIKSITPKGATIMHVRQGEALGLGDAIAKANPLIGDNLFAVVLPDVLLSNQKAGHSLQEMVASFIQTSASQILVESVANELVEQYGIADCGGQELLAQQSADVWPLHSVVEKPSVGQAPSNLAVVGRYIFSARIWQYLERLTPSVGGEIQLTDAIAQLLTAEAVYACKLQGKSHDCCSKLGYLTANVEFALSHPELGAPFASAVRDLMSETQQIEFIDTTDVA